MLLLQLARGGRFAKARGALATAMTALGGVLFAITLAALLSAALAAGWPPLEPAPPWPLNAPVALANAARSGQWFCIFTNGIECPAAVCRFVDGGRRIQAVPVKWEAFKP